MPPTVQSGKRSDSDRKSRGTGEKRSDLVMKVKYDNSLPDIPFDPKFITYPFEPNRFVQYNPTSLERSYKHDLLTEHDLGVGIDLINPDTYTLDPNAYLDEEDEKLLEEDFNTPADSKRSRHHNKSVSWLRKTEYISTEYNRFTQSADRSEAKVGFNMKKHFNEEDLYKDRESQIEAIEKTFNETKKPIQDHYSKPGVKPVEILPIFPDFQMWKHPCAQVIFDSDPAPAGRSQPAQIEEMSQAMIRGMVDESGDQFVAYFLPSEETLEKRAKDASEHVDYDPETEYEYSLAREYNWNVKNKLSKGYEETYFFVFKDDGVHYNELETRVRLSKRRKIGPTAGPQNKSKLIVKHREMNDQEKKSQGMRLTMLEPPTEEEEEEEMPELQATQEMNLLDLKMLKRWIQIIKVIMRSTGGADQGVEVTVGVVVEVEVDLEVAVEVEVEVEVEDVAGVDLDPEVEVDPGHEAIVDLGDQDQEVGVDHAVVVDHAVGADHVVGVDPVAVVDLAAGPGAIVVGVVPVGQLVVGAPRVVGVILGVEMSRTKQLRDIFGSSSDEG